MLTLEALSNLLESIDDFLAEAARINKDRVLAPIERRLFKAAQAFFLKQGRLFAARHKYYQTSYTEAISEDELAAIMGEIAAETEEEFRVAAQAAMGEAMGKASASLIASMEAGEVIGVAFDLSNPVAVKWLEQHGAELVTGINEETMRQMRTLITRATDEGWSYQQTAKEIKNKFDGFSGRMPQAHIRSRAEGIAVTESRFAYEQANLRTAMELKAAGLDMEKSWLAESGACPVCEMNAADDWIPLEEAFSSGDDAPPAHPYCRCDLLTRRKGAGED